MTNTELSRALVAHLEGWAKGIVPERVYTPEEAADLCGWRGPDLKHPARSFREATRGRLPVVKLTAKGQRIGYYGRDLLRFIESQREAT